VTLPLTVQHLIGDRVTVAAGGTEILSYVHRPDPVAYESCKPYAHPLRTLAGRTVTGYRPNDHRWHKGLQMTASHLSGQNLWGGNSYIHPGGYQRIPERVGAMRHDGFPLLDATEDAVRLGEELTWLNHTGQSWAREHRTLTVHAVDEAAGSWALDWSIELTNVRGEPLRFGSPTTAGREMAGYTGLHWRGPRDYTDGRVLTPAGPATETEVMGAPAAATPWIALAAAHDEVDAESTVVFAHAPENLGDGAVHPSHWFVRSSRTPTVAFSWAFFEEFTLDPGASFAFRYRLLIADGAWDAERIDRGLAAVPW
jgi:hypothetical protein